MVNMDPPFGPEYPDRMAGPARYEASKKLKMEGDNRIRETARHIK
jgi:hypothetical protein